MAQQIVLKVEDSSVVTSLRKVLSLMKGVTIVNITEEKMTEKKRSSYEQAREDIRNGRVNTYNSLNDFYEEMGI